MTDMESGPSLVSTESAVAANTRRTFKEGIEYMTDVYEEMANKWRQLEVEAWPDP